MFFKAHLKQKKGFRAFLRKPIMSKPLQLCVCVKLSTVTSKRFAEQDIQDISLFFRPKHKYFTNGENKVKYLLEAKEPVASRFGRD